MSNTKFQHVTKKFIGRDEHVRMLDSILDDAAQLDLRIQNYKNSVVVPRDILQFVQEASKESKMSCAKLAAAAQLADQLDPALYSKTDR